MAEGKNDREFRELLNPDFGYFYTIDKTLYKGKTKFQSIEMVHSPEFGNTLLLDGITQVVEKNEYQYHEPMVHPSMCCHPRPRDVLVVGGGDGGILREVLKYPTVRHVDFAELDAEVVDFSRKYLAKMNKKSFDDDRVVINIVDGRKFVEEHTEAYDIVIMDMTDPFGPSKYLYTKEFFSAVKKALRGPEGIFTMHTESPISRPVVFNSIVKTLESVFANVETLYTYIQMYAVLWSIGVCSDGERVRRSSAAVINRKLARYGIDDLHVFTGDTFSAMKTRYPYINAILKKRARVITDKRPDFPVKIV